MAKILYEGRSFECAPEETVLESLERQGQPLQSFCRSGVCQSCLLRATRGTPPPASQLGLKEAWKRQGYFLSCVCRVESDLDVSRCDEGRSFPTRIIRVEGLSSDVLKVTLQCPADFRFDAGQFVQLVRPSDGLMRPYSVASLPSSGLLELHVARLPQGRMSGWLATAQGEAAEVRGPFGECVYLPDEQERPLLLAGTGTGLAPLLGVLRAALAAKHRGPIRLIHGAVSQAGLYLWSELERLCDQAAQLRLVGSVLHADQSESAQLPRIQSGPLDQIVLGSDVAWSEQRVYLCGHPDLVRTLKKKIFLAGTPLQRIHADPFLPPKLA